MSAQPESPKPRKKPGPPKGQLYKLNDAVLEKLRQAFAIDATIEEACFYADINPATYYLWKKARPEQFEKLELLRNTPVLAARQTIASGVKNDPVLALKYLERKRRSEFALRSELTGEDGTPINPYAALTPDELRKLASKAK